MTIYAKLYHVVQKMYEEFFKQCSLNKSFEFKLSKNDRTTLLKWIKWIKNNYKKHQITNTLLIQYFEFQFSRYAGLYSAGYGRNKVMFNWIVGEKAIQAWEGRKMSQKWMVKFAVNSEIKLRLSKLFSNEYHDKLSAKRDKIFVGLNEVEELSKQKFHNTMKGLLYCDLNTTLYNPISKWCLGCQYSSLCKSNLEKLYPKLFALRSQKD